MKTTQMGSRCALRLLLCLAISAATASAQSVNYLVYTPNVLAPGMTAPLLVEVELTAAATSVTIDFSPSGATASAITLRDDGTEGDRVAGDRAYSARLPVAPILAALENNDVNRVLIGFLNVFNGSTRTMIRSNLFVDVYTSAIGTYPVSRLSQFVQATTRIVNIHDATYFSSRNLAPTIREFYRHFPDNYDVLNVVFTLQRFENRTHPLLKNTTGGIGLGNFDMSAAYGSAGRLVGISSFPISTSFDGAESGFLHEFAHQWVNHIRGNPFGAGSPHWPYLSMANGIMGFSIGGAGGQGGNFSCEIREDPRGFLLTRRSDAPVYNDFDLYLMGLMPANEVRQQFVFADQSTTPRCDGSIYTGAMTRVSVNDLIASAGVRVPAFGEAPNNFRMATIIITRDGLASQEMMSLYSWMAERAEWRTPVPTHVGLVKEFDQPFYVATGRRGTLQMNIDLRRPDFALTPVTSSATVRAGEEARYEIGVFSRGSTLDTPVTLTCDSRPANSSNCAFQSTALTPSAGGQTTVMSIGTTGVQRGTHLVIVSGRNGDEKHSTAVTLVVQ